ncbi:MAG: hypothetical protein ACNI27_13015 [Desulfovibrio sp.]
MPKKQFFCTECDNWLEPKDLIAKCLCPHCESDKLEEYKLGRPVRASRPEVAGYIWMASIEPVVREGV